MGRIRLSLRGSRRVVVVVVDGTEQQGEDSNRNQKTVEIEKSENDPVKRSTQNENTDQDPDDNVAVADINNNMDKNEDGKKDEYYDYKNEGGEVKEDSISSSDVEVEVVEEVEPETETEPENDSASEMDEPAADSSGSLASTTTTTATTPDTTAAATPEITNAQPIGVAEPVPGSESRCKPGEGSPLHKISCYSTIHPVFIISGLVTSALFIICLLLRRKSHRTRMLMLGYGYGSGSKHKNKGEYAALAVYDELLDDFDREDLSSYGYSHAEDSDDDSIGTIISQWSTNNGTSNNSGIGNGNGNSKTRKIEMIPFDDGHLTLREING